MSITYLAHYKIDGCIRTKSGEVFGDYGWIRVRPEWHERFQKLSMRMILVKMREKPNQVTKSAANGFFGRDNVVRLVFRHPEASSSMVSNTHLV